jgi:hypothetical protein
MHPITVALLINSALYITGCFVAGIVTNNPAAWKLALFTAALCYLAPMAQTFPGKAAETTAYGLIVMSVLAGAAAGWFLLIGG